MPKRELRGPAPVDAVIIPANEAPAADAEDDVVDAAPVVLVSDLPPAPAAAPALIPPPAAAHVSLPASTQNEDLLKLVMEQQRQQIQALTSLVQDLHSKVAASVPPPVVSAVAALTPPPTSRGASNVPPPPPRSARATGSARNARRRPPSASGGSATASSPASAFGRTVPQLPNQAALGNGSSGDIAPPAPRRARTTPSRPVSSEGGDESSRLSTYLLRRETRGAAGRRVWDHKSNTPRSQTAAGVFAARDEIRSGSSYVVRGFSGMV